MIKRLWLKNYRNFSELTLDLSQDKHLYVIGENNQGKTNLLESVFSLAYLRGARESNIENLILWGKDRADLGVDFQKGEDLYRMYLSLDSQKKKEIYINNKRQLHYKGVRDLFPVQYVSADVIKIFQGFADIRRQVLDTFLAEYDDEYAVLLKQYQGIIKQKSTALKQELGVSIITLYNRQLVPIAAQIVRKRVDGLQVLELELIKLLNRFSKINYQTLELKYQAKSFDKLDNDEFLDRYETILSDKLGDNIKKEMQVKSALYGPHRDDFYLYMNQKQLQVFWSRGINRILSILFLLSIAILLSHKTGAIPVFLLDDTLVEIDQNHRKDIIDMFLDISQVFYATTQEDDMKFFRDTRMVRIIDGNIQ